MEEHSTCNIQRYYLVCEKVYDEDYGQSREDRAKKVNTTWRGIPRVSFIAAPSMWKSR